MKLFFIIVGVCLAIVGQTDFSISQEIPAAGTGIRLISYELGGKFYSSPRNRPEGLSECNIIISVPHGLSGISCRVE